MKHLFLLCITLLLSISVYGQKDSENYIKAGKPVFVIAKRNNCRILSENIDREKTELETNFKLLNVEVREVLSLKKGEGIQFENEAHTTVYIEGDNNLGDNCTKVIFWDGKSTSDPIVYKGLYLSTEYFFPKLLKKKVQSNYYTYFLSKLEQYKNKEEKITSHSKEVSDRFVYYELVKEIDYSNFMSSYELLPVNTKGIKVIQVKCNGKNNSRTIYLNEKGQLIKRRSFFEDGEESSINEYVYENGLLRKKIQKSNKGAIDETLYAYNDNEIFAKAISKDNPPFENYYNCNYAQLKEDFLDLYIVHFSTFDYSVNERAAVIKQGNLIVNKELDLTIHLSRTKNYLPITYKYKNKEGKIIAKQPTLWENIFEGEKTEYHWDNNQRISKIVITEGKEKTVYTYEYEMY